MDMGIFLIVVGVIIIIIGLIIHYFTAIRFLGKLPGDIHIRRENFLSIFHCP
jgi:uncharacterized protein YneF (UPF0154 family)